MKQHQLIVQLRYFLIRSAQSKITLFIFCIKESGQETKDTQFVVSVVILCDESCCNAKFTGFDMNIRLAQFKLFNVWSYDSSNPGGKTSGPQRQIGVMTMPVGKSRTVGSICLSVSIYFKTHFSGMFFPYLPISTNDVT